MVTVVRRSPEWKSGAGSWKTSAACTTRSTPLLFSSQIPIPHQVGEAFVPRLIAVDETLYGHQWLAGIRDLDAIAVDLDHHRCSSHGEVLVDQRIGDELTDDDVRHQLDLLAKCVLDHFVLRKLIHHELHEPLEPDGITANAHPVELRFEF